MWFLILAVLVAIWRNEYKNPMSQRFGRIGKVVSASLIVVAILLMGIGIEYASVKP